ncbi:MAG: SPFH domain-containing protein [Clostridia bacterium]|nr:SPFH domain-containing protein [Clostridia bacterium]
MERKEYQEKILKPANGFVVLFALIFGILAGVGILVFGAITMENGGSIALGIVCLVGGIIVMLASAICMCGLKVVGPNEALVLVLFGKYYGTIKSEGFFFTNPFATSAYAKAPADPIIAEPTTAKNLFGATATMPKRKVSLKAITLTNGIQKVNDLEGNPIEIGVVVIWKVINTAKAVFNVDDYFNFISTQADSSIRQVARLYPYDVSEEGDEKSLRGSSVEIAENLKKELQERVEIAGIEIIEARIAHLAYAPEIAAAMLQRQQARAIITARQMIVEGTVGMVEMALEKLAEGGVVELDEERKAQMVSNLLVVLCGNKDAQPIVNSGTIY